MWTRGHEVFPPNELRNSLVSLKYQNVAMRRQSHEIWINTINIDHMLSEDFSMGGNPNRYKESPERLLN